MIHFNKRISFFVKASISIAFVFWLVYKVQWYSVLELIRGMRWHLVVWYLLTIILGVAISAKKWSVIARFKGFQRKWYEYFFAYLSGTFVNNFMPGFIGGDAYRSYWLGKQRDGFLAAVSTVIFDRVTGLFAAGILAVIFSMMRFESMIQSSLWSLTVVLLFLLLVGITVWGLAWKRVSHITAVQWVVSFLPKKVQAFLSEVRDYMHISVMMPSMILAFAFTLLGVGIANWLLFLAFGQNIPLLDFFAVIFMVNIIASIPISVNNIGIKEWAYFSFFPLVGAHPEAAIAVALAGRFFQMLLSFTALPYFLRRKEMQDSSFKTV